MSLMSDEYISRKEFTVALHKLCKARESKIVFFTSNLNNAGRVVIDNGKIISIRFFNKSGQQALDAVLEIEGVKFRFDEMPSGMMPDSDVPSTQDVFSMLLSSSDDPSADIDASAGMQLSQSVKNDIENHLIDIIGPMGSVLCQDILQTATNIHQVMGELSQHLSAEDLNALKKGLDIT